jgi:transcriptional repressor NrdR
MVVLRDNRATTPSTLWDVNCPSCDAETRVLESRRADEGAAVRRRRECRKCGRRFTSFERREPERAWVTKRSGDRQLFDRRKLLSALAGATHKRDVDPRELELIVNRIQAEAESSGGELSADRIGELCLDGLRELDHGAYLQFAGTLPDASGNPRKDGQSGLPSSVRSAEDAALPPPESNREEKI